MKKIAFIAIAIIACASFSGAARSVRVKGYTRKKTGKYVASSQRTAPNQTKADNWSAKGNVNPYTGKEGTKDPLK